jgi:hypothetical protein
VAGQDQAWAAAATTALRLVADLRAARTPAGREACAIMSLPGMTGRRAASVLGITPQAMSERLKAARWALDKPAVDLAKTVLSHPTATLAG